MTVINLVSKDSRIIIKQSNSNIRLTQLKYNIRFKSSGPRGLQGEKGDPGVGLPAGGSTGDIIVKQSDADYDFTYVSPNNLADKNYVQSFTTTTSVMVNHNLNKYPSVSVLDSAGDEVIGVVKYDTLDTLTLIFTDPFSGTVTCN